MATADRPSWLAPASSQLNLTNCTAASYWLAVLLDQHYYDTEYHDAPIGATFEYLQSVIPHDYYHISKPSLGDILTWYETMDDSTWERLLDFPTKQCPVTLCRKLRWEGDPDLAGIGVMAVYYLAAALSTLYLVILALDAVQPFSSHSRARKSWKSLVRIFRESLNSFIDAALLFAIAMLLAGTYRYGSSRLHPDKTHSLYGLVCATYMGIFSIFPPLMLQSVAPDLRRRRIRLTLWLVVITFGLTVAALDLSLRTDRGQLEKLLGRDSASVDIVWEYDCEPQQLRNALQHTLGLAEVILLLSISWWIYHVAPSRLWDRVRNSFGVLERVWKLWPHVCHWIMVIYQITCCGVMWALLGLFTRYRLSLKTTMGTSYKDSQWSFGQVLALTTWFPVLVDLITTYLYGPVDALQGKMSEHYSVVESTLADDSGTALIQSPRAQGGHPKPRGFHVRLGDTEGQDAEGL